MRSAVDIGVDAVGGATRVTRLDQHGALAARITLDSSGDTIHLVGTAAGPLSGDLMTITVRLGAGARLRLRSVAAAVVLPCLPTLEPVRPARVRIGIEVAENGGLDLELQPTIVCQRAALVQTVTATVHPSARLRLREALVAGRHDEPGGMWASRLDVHRDGAPVLRQLTTDRTSPARVLLCGVDLGPEDEAADQQGRPHAVGDAACGAVRCHLAPGGWTTTAWGPDLTSARTGQRRLSRIKGLDDFGLVGDALLDHDRQPAISG